VKSSCLVVKSPEVLLYPRYGCQPYRLNAGKRRACCFCFEHSKSRLFKVEVATGASRQLHIWERISYWFSTGEREWTRSNSGGESRHCHVRSPGRWIRGANSEKDWAEASWSLEQTHYREKGKPADSWTSAARTEQAGSLAEPVLPVCETGWAGKRWRAMTGGDCEQTA
jgi:hypothetical protein